MEASLEQYLMQFKDLTARLLECIDDEKFDELDIHFNMRQKTIEDMENISYAKEEFYNICAKLDILKLQGELEKKISDKREELREKMDKLSEQKTAQKSYNKNFYSEAHFLSKRI